MIYETVYPSGSRSTEVREAHMESFDNVYKKPFAHDIVVTIKGNAGETKTVSVRAAEDRLLVFRGQTIKGADTVGGTGTLLRDITILGKSQIRRVVLTREIEWSFNRGVHFEALHPRSEVSFTVQFVRDCEWTGVICGRAVQVQDEGVYAITPTVPCNRPVPREVSEEYNYWVNKSRARARCEHCWFTFGDHAWPWKDREIPVEFESLASGEERDFLIEAPNRFIPHAAVVADDKERELFVTPGFDFAGSQPFRRYVEKAQPFNYYLPYNSSFHVDTKRALLLRVGNASKERRPFKGTVRALEHVGA